MSSRRHHKYPKQPKANDPEYYAPQLTGPPSYGPYGDPSAGSSSASESYYFPPLPNPAGGTYLMPPEIHLPPGQAPPPLEQELPPGFAPPPHPYYPPSAAQPQWSPTPNRLSPWPEEASRHVSYASSLEMPPPRANDEYGNLLCQCPQVKTTRHIEKCYDRFKSRYNELRQEYHEDEARVMRKISDKNHDITRGHYRKNTSSKTGRDLYKKLDGYWEDYLNLKGDHKNRVMALWLPYDNAHGIHSRREVEEEVQGWPQIKRIDWDTHS